MIDRATFKRLNPNYAFPIPKESDHQALFDESIPTLNVGARNQQVQEGELDNDDLLLTTPVVYGFSLMDKMWLEFNVEKIQPIQWNQEAFDNLVLPSNRKELLRTLVEAHTQDLGFDDFISGKGQGLVINLFGNPGVGKTLSAEATSEHVRRPLYIVGAGDLGTTAFEMNATLERTFDIATSWKAIVLIDEADVFMEKRSLHDLDRNAMVSVILRHLEYYRGILFITTNRVKTIDDAFRSRTHVALHFQELAVGAKSQVWTAFLEKVGIKAGAEDGRVTVAQLEQLAARPINGRQIKNAVRTASSLALGRSQKLAYKHFVETLDAMDDFTAEYTAATA